MAFDSLNCRWCVSKTNQEYIDYISRIASVSPICAQVLINRGLKTPEQIDSFFNPDLNKLSDPFELLGMERAVNRIMFAKKNNERVLICGDYDADGITATSMMFEGLKKLSIDVDYFIPNRLLDGYGFVQAGVDKAKSIGAKLIITVDCGISSFDAVSKAKSYGIDVIITDHHEPLKSEIYYGDNNILLPDVVAIINPKIDPCLYNQSFLSGAGVAFKLLMAVFGNISDVYEFLDLAAIGTTADVVPLLGDNRIIIKEGIKLIHAGQRTGIKALKSISGIRSDFFKSTFLNYVLIPRINAAGRIADATEVVRLLTTKSDVEAERLSLWLNELNTKRQQIEEKVYNEAKKKVNELESIEGAIVVASEGWHLGVIGIVASKIAEMFYRPTFVFSLKDGVAKGSSRSIPSFNIHKAIEECKDLLTTFGGHKQAAGLSLNESNLEVFRHRISKIVIDRLTPEDLIPTINIDAPVSFADINHALIDEISSFEPFGYGNEEPLLGTKGLQAVNTRIVGNNHLKMYLRQNGKGFDSIGFDLGDHLEMVENNAFIDAAFNPILNEWDGGKYIQLNLKAIRPTK